MGGGRDTGVESDSRTGRTRVGFKTQGTKTNLRVNSRTRRGRGQTPVSSGTGYPREEVSSRSTGATDTRVGRRTTAGTRVGVRDLGGESESSRTTGGGGPLTSTRV